LNKRIMFLFLVTVIFMGPSWGLAQPEKGNLSTVLEDFSQMDAGQKELILSSMGVPKTLGFSWAKLFAWTIFGGIGFIAFVYGKKQESFPPLIVGISLLVFPYFIKSTLWLYIVGSGLCLLMYFWRD